MDMQNLAYLLEDFLKKNINGYNGKDIINMSTPLLSLNYLVDGLIDNRVQKYSNANTNQLFFLLLKCYYDKNLIEKQSISIKNEKELFIKKSELLKKDNNQLEERLMLMQEDLKGQKLNVEESNMKHRKEIFEMQQQLNNKLMEVQNALDKAINEKNSMVLKYAISEKDVLNWKGKCEKNQDLFNRDSKLRDQLNLKLKNTMLDLNRVSSTLDIKNKEINVLKKELKCQTELAQGNALSLKWTQDKLNQEVETHKETKNQLEYTIARFGTLQSEIGKLQNLKYNESDDDILNKSFPCQNSLQDNHLDARKSHVIQNDTENNSVDLILSVELDVLREKYKRTLNDLTNATFKISMFEQDKSELANKLKDMEKSLCESQARHCQTELELSQCRNDCKHLEKIKVELDTLKMEFKSLEEGRNETVIELGKIQERERKLLLLNESTSLENAKHLAEIFLLNEKVETLTKDYDQFYLQNIDLQSKLETLNLEKDTFENENKRMASVKEELFNQKDKLILEYENTVENLQSEIKALKKKLTACQKELTSHIKLLNVYKNEKGSGELNKNIVNSQNEDTVSLSTNSSDQVSPRQKLPPRLGSENNKRFYDTLESAANQIHTTEDDTLSYKSYESSSVSGIYAGTSAFTTTPDNKYEFSFFNPTSSSCHEPQTLRKGDYLNFSQKQKSSSRPSLSNSPNLSAQQREALRDQLLEDETNMRLLIEKSVRLQKSLIKKKDKVEFLNDHIVRLQEELHKKGRIIQTLLINEHSGALTKEDISRDNKLNLNVQPLTGTILATLPSISSTNSPALTAEINSKLQTLLEDSILKIIILKEGMENLGHEISRLNQENRQLKLSSGLTNS